MPPPLDAALAQARAQLEAGQPFEAHDTLEAAWMTAEGQLKTALQGLIQLCAGLHKHARGETAGAHYLLSRGLSKLERCRQALPPGTAEAFERRALAAFAQLREGA